MKHPILYIKSKGQYIAHFTELTGGQLTVVGNINAVLQILMPQRTGHAFLLYEQREPEVDYSNIHFLRSWLPKVGILLITSKRLSDTERRKYLEAGVNNALSGSVDKASFDRALRFMTDYTFTHKPVVHQREIRHFHMPLWKRAFDIAASLSAILLLSPLLIAVAIAVRLDSPGPIIYRSKRVGSNYRVFNFLKFRSMRTDADQQLKTLGELNQYASSDGANESAEIELSAAEIEQLLANADSNMLFSDEFAIQEADHQQRVDTEQENAFVKIENDPRITRLGRFLRKYSIDELPQLFNILRGDMSVVGNRPLPLYEAECLTSDEYIERFICPAGLTGLWQVEKRGGAGKLSPEQRKLLDIEYARKMSFWFDLKIILRTFTAFIQKENV